MSPPSANPIRARVYSCLALRLLPALDLTLERLVACVAAPPGIVSAALHGIASAAAPTGIASAAPPPDIVSAAAAAGNAGAAGETGSGRDTGGGGLGAGRDTGGGLVSDTGGGQGEARCLLHALLRAYRPLYAHHPSRAALALALLCSLPPHPRSPASTRLLLLGLACPLLPASEDQDDAMFTPERNLPTPGQCGPSPHHAGTDAPTTTDTGNPIPRRANPTPTAQMPAAQPELSAQTATGQARATTAQERSAARRFPTPIPPPRRRGALWGCTVAFSRYAAPVFAREEDRWRDTAGGERCATRAPAGGDEAGCEGGSGEGGGEESGEGGGGDGGGGGGDGDGGKGSDEGGGGGGDGGGDAGVDPADDSAAAEAAFRQAVLGGDSFGTSASVAAAYAAEVISRTVCRLAAASAGPPIGIPEVRDIYTDGLYTKGARAHTQKELTCTYRCLCI